jgi:FemAB-related protein (PEP-CTERM system-associated)
MPLALTRLSRKDLAGGERADAWDAYCQSHPSATPYHLSAWGRAVAEVLEHEPYGLSIEDAGRITGVLPLFLRRSRLFGTNLVSVPAANVGGPLADDDATLQRLVEGAVALARELNVDFLELRNVAPGSPAASALQLDPGRYVSVEIDLTGGEAAVWNRLSRGTRRRVRRAQDAGLAVELRDDLASFYPVYASAMKRLGSPPFSKRFFAALGEGFGDSLQFGVARLGPRVAAVDSIVTWNGIRYSVFAGSAAGLWRLYPNQLLLWDEIRDACARGLRTFDLGRSLAGSGSLVFKLSWGSRVVPLTYGYSLHRARQLPVRTPDMPLYRALGRVWSLLPDPVVTAVGPHLVKHLF